MCCCGRDVLLRNYLCSYWGSNVWFVMSVLSLGLHVCVATVTFKAEHAEKICYNALPATITPDMWAHQYLQEVNEANAVHIDHHVWASDGPDAIL